MIWKPADQLVREEVESVRARMIILDQLESGPKTGNELREAIRKDMMAQAVKAGVRKPDPADYVVTDPKLYFNTKHLENIGLVQSKRESKERIFRLAPHAIQPVRRVLDIKRKRILITSLVEPGDARHLIGWYCKERKFSFKKLHVVVEMERFQRGVSKNLERYIPDGSVRKINDEWHELPLDVAGEFGGGKQGDLDKTYQAIEKIILQDIREYNIILDVSLGPPVISMAMMLLATHYSLDLIYVREYSGKNSEVQMVTALEVVE
ncbi:MAG: hypothetical protein BAJATHORv1_100074 [Candidatus Thorarchaeota archaeon]|nr:MAG: hypothetical protein BAJATHORv1_100074 [Candidatus Thorarchaeota archaeon]